MKVAAALCRSAWMEKRCGRLEVESSPTKSSISNQILTLMSVTATARPLSPFLLSGDGLGCEQRN
ncbi:unnamed protein product [Linum tenue]|uniref:Uncharacterized protein n=1 Tax=Linum tenue TaxID=586396 RepID=A0AAV0R3R3_9ROSI|nr:unnamed protein product [Linum tenue]